MKIKILTEAEVKGSRSYMEDTHLISTRPEGTLLAVFDGHGGHAASAFAWEHFAALFLVEMGRCVGDAKKALLWSIAELAETLKENRDGTTLSAVYVPDEGNVATVAVVGDSPVLIGDTTHLWVGPDHNVRSNPSEADAVQDRGGFISSDGYAFRTYDGQGLQMGRALGDSALRSILSTEPEIHEVPLIEGGFILVATDGLFDPSYRNHAAVGDVVKLLRSNAHGEFTAEELVENALFRETGDNVTAILARL